MASSGPWQHPTTGSPVGPWQHPTTGSPVGPWQHPTTGSPAGPLQKRRRGRPRKVVTGSPSPVVVPQQKRRRGRPRKVLVPTTTSPSLAGPQQNVVVPGSASGGDHTNKAEAEMGFPQGSVVSDSHAMPTTYTPVGPGQQHPTTVSPAGPQQKRRRGRPSKVVVPTTGSPSPSPVVVPQQKRQRGRPRKVLVPTTTSPSPADPQQHVNVVVPGSASGGSVGVQGDTNKAEAEMGFPQGSVVSDSAMATDNSEHVPAAVQVGPSNPITDFPYNIDLISQQFPGFHLYVQLLQNPGLSSLPSIQQSLAMLLPNVSLQQPASTTALSSPTERLIPAVSAPALQHHNPMPTVPSNRSYYRNTGSSVPTVSASALQYPMTTDLSNKSYRNPPRRQEGF